VCTALAQTRHRQHNTKRKHTKDPFWHAKTERAKYPEYISPDNEEFLRETVAATSPLLRAPLARGEWAPKSQRCGLIGKKLGSYPLWLKDGRAILTTLLQICDNHVIKYVPYAELVKNLPERNLRIRYVGKPRGQLIVGADGADPRLFTKEYAAMFSAVGLLPKRKLTRFLVTDNAVLSPGTPLHATHFRPGDRLDIAGYTRDQGFQGVLVRHHFKGMPAQNGVTKSHRRPGYIGFGGTRVMKGKKLPGHEGFEWRCLRGVEIMRVDSAHNCIWINGRIMGAVGDYLNLYDSGLHHNRYRDPSDHPPFPTHYPAEDPVEHVDWHHPRLHNMRDESIEFEKDVA